MCDIRKYIPEFVTELIDWDGFNDYKIIYHRDDKFSLVIAQYLKSFFKDKDNIELEIYSDEADVQDKEILVGNTNRYKTKLCENQFAVSVKHSKLVFEGGHRVMVEKAAKWFMTLERESRKLFLLSGTAEDFKATLDGGYKYVWGDEFDGNFLDTTKLTKNGHMECTPSMAVLTDNDSVFKIENGEMKMAIIPYKDDNNDVVEYATSIPVCTGDTMWWLYGYAEIKARIPLTHGAWPAWWATSYCHSKKGSSELKNWKYLSEIDFFEVFGRNTQLEPQLHKWYRNHAGTFTEIYDEDGKQITHTEYKRCNRIDYKKYFFEENKNNKYQYHIFGFKWTPEEMIMSVDGEDYMTFNLNFNFDGLTDMSGFKELPIHMIFDNWAYAPGLSPLKQYPDMEINPEEDLPIEFCVEYVRLYQRDGEGYIINTGVDRIL